MFEEATLARRNQPLLIGILLATVALIAVGVWLLVAPPSSPQPAPVPRPTRAALDKAIAAGRNAFIEKYVKTSWEEASDGGYVDYVDAVGQKHTYGPRVYIACQLYLMTHFLMYADDFDVPRDDPLYQSVRDWLINEYDPQAGRWIWSEEGCLHPKGMMALVRSGHRDQVDPAWRWARASQLWLPEQHMFTMRQSGDIIQTLGRATLSLSGKSDWEHGAPIPDPEASAKFLHAMLEAGHSLQEPEMTELNDGINDYFEKNTLRFDEMDTRDVIGMVWYVFCTHHFDLPRRGGYDFCIRTMSDGIAAGGVLRKNSLTEHFAAVRGLVIKALLLADIRLPEMDAEIQSMLDRQSPDGDWPLTPAAKKTWGLGVVPPVGIKTGQMDGANTYLITLALMAYRDAMYP